MGPSANLQLPSNVIATQEVIEEMTSAIIRTPSGRQLVVDWGMQDPKIGVTNVLNRVFDKAEPLQSVKDQKETEKIDQTSQAQSDDKNEQVHNIKVEEDQKTESKSEQQTTQAEKEGGKEAQSAGSKNETNKTEVTEYVSTTQSTVAKTQTNQQGATMNIKTKKNEVILKTDYFLSTKSALYLQTYVGGKISKNGKWVNASKDEIQKYFLPSQDNINKYKYQFLSLEKMAGISEIEAGKFLKGKGILDGKEAMFLAAAKQNNINEIYLMAHACLETGNGTSKLATGVSYKGKVVYNMFGIGAYDNNAVTKGAEYAYKAGWTTPEKAIMGGAKFISENYINNSIYKQDTLYEMRWNPGSPGSHQYATDVAWATKQAVWIEQIYKKFDDPHVIFDIPVYMAGTGKAANTKK